MLPAVDGVVESARGTSSGTRWYRRTTRSRFGAAPHRDDARRCGASGL